MVGTHVQKCYRTDNQLANVSHFESIGLTTFSNHRELFFSPWYIRATPDSNEVFYPLTFCCSFIAKCQCCLRNAWWLVTLLTTTTELKVHQHVTSLTIWFLNFFDLILLLTVLFFYVLWDQLVLYVSLCPTSTNHCKSAIFTSLSFPNFVLFQLFFSFFNLCSSSSGLFFGNLHNNNREIPSFWAALPW